MPTKLPLLLLPPSEGKTTGGRGRPWLPGTMSVDLDERRQQVIDALRIAMADSEAARSKLLGVKGEALAAATAANLSIGSGSTMRAIDRYSGVLYSAIEPATLSAVQRRRLGSTVLVFSGLWGLVAPNDPIPDYKLKMGAALPSLGKLSTWWRPAIDEAMADRAAGRVVWNLLPNEHDAAWTPSRSVRAQFTVRFLQRDPDGSLSAVTHWNKYLKGALVRFLLDEPAAGPGELAGWEHPMGYRFDPTRTEQSAGTTLLTFVRGE